MTESSPSLKASRQRLADLVTAAVEQTATILTEEQEALARRFPAMAHQPAPVSLDPAAIRDFTRSDEYRQAVESYVEGRLEVNLLVEVLELLEQIAPLEFLRRWSRVWGHEHPAHDYECLPRSAAVAFPE